LLIALPLAKGKGTFEGEMTFGTEKMLVESFLEILESDRTPWSLVRFTCEFSYSRGRTDVIAVGNSGTLVAFEAKLTDWKYALHQAYRNTCFAHRSYVVLPKKAALIALRYLGEFEKRGVGLCYVDCAKITVLRESSFALPIEPWLASEAISYVHGRYPAS
jgi:hypothetical protein